MRMSKIIFWIVLIFVVLFALRLINSAKAQRGDTRRARRRRAARRADGALPALRRLSAASPTRVQSPAASPAPTGSLRRDALSRCDPRPAIPSFEPPPAACAGRSESGRRILWIVGLYRAVCGALLLGTALLLDLRVLAIAAPNAFVTAAGLYFLFGLATFWWVQRDSAAAAAARAVARRCWSATSSSSPC